MSRESVTFSMNGPFLKKLIQRLTGRERMWIAGQEKHTGVEKGCCKGRKGGQILHTTITKTFKLHPTSDATVT